MQWIKRNVKWFVSTVVTAGMAYLGGTGVWMSGKQAAPDVVIQGGKFQCVDAGRLGHEIAKVSSVSGDSTFVLVMTKHNDTLYLVSRDTTVHTEKNTFVVKATPKL